MKVIFNNLPPARIDHPSSSLSILQSFLNHNGISSKTIYWNILLFQVMSYYEINHEVFRNLVPFLIDLSKEFDDNTVKKRLLSYLQTKKPEFKIKNNFYENSYDEIFTFTKKIIQDEIDKEENRADLYGISAKFYQWIPGRMLAKIIKEKYPDSKIVVGGLSTRDAAVAMLKKNPDFDYAIWGEGEYPLLDLCNFLDNKSILLADISRIAYRENSEIKTSKTSKSRYLDFQNYIFPDISDYIDTFNKYNILPKEKIQLLIHTVCGCGWNQCSFCTYSNDKIFRERSPENIFQEIKLYSDKYNIRNIYMADNEIVGRDIGRFEKLLDLLIDFRQKGHSDFHIYGEMIPSSDINPDIFIKMAAAGFRYLFIGYEAVTDSLLKKMKKKNSFSENIYFVKFALKNHIRPQVNILQAIPDETEDDVYESIDNLHFLRFFFNAETDFFHDFLTLNLYKGTEYFQKMSDVERNKYTINQFTPYIPKAFLENKEYWDFFSFRKQNIDNSNAWFSFRSIENYYKNNTFSYKINSDNFHYVYSEILNGKIIKTHDLNQIEYDILKETETQILSEDNLFNKLSNSHSDLSIEELKANLLNLKKKYLVYFNSDYSSIISVLHLS